MFVSCLDFQAPKAREAVACSALFLVAFVSATATAQGRHYRGGGIPRTADGEPDLSAPTPRFPDGKPDFYGIWTSDKPALPFGERLIEIKPEDVVLTPVGEALQRQRTDLSWRCAWRQDNYRFALANFA